MLPLVPNCLLVSPIWVIIVPLARLHWKHHNHRCIAGIKHSSRTGIINTLALERCSINTILNRLNRLHINQTLTKHGKTLALTINLHATSTGPTQETTVSWGVTRMGVTCTPGRLTFLRSPSLLLLSTFPFSSVGLRISNTCAPQDRKIHHMGHPGVVKLACTKPLQHQSALHGSHGP